MKSSLLQSLLITVVFAGTLGFSSCKKDKCQQTVTYTTYTPVYMSYAQMRSAVKAGPAQPLKNPGKIYLQGNYIFVNELNAGIHIIDNSNPASPNNMAFISIPGNVDLAANGNNLYADSYIDLLVFDISNFSNITLVKRIENAFPYNYNYNGHSVDSVQGVVSHWAPKAVTQVVGNDCSAAQPVYSGLTYNAAYNTNTSPNVAVAPDISGTGTAAGQGAPGAGGSTARFAIANATLYTVSNNGMNIYNVSNSANPLPVSGINLGWSIETIFPYNNRLFIGSAYGFYIYDISNPLSPVDVGEYSHLYACDPVVVNGNYAYFTLNSDAPCHMGNNELDVVDISNMANPQLLNTVPLTSPRGLGIDSTTLFICDSKDGLKIFNAANAMQIQNNMIAHFGNINAFDVIPYKKRLLMTGSDGLYQYDYSNIQNISLLSKIAVQN